MKVGIINATSYFGLDLLRLISSHPRADVTSITARSQAGKRLGEVFPHVAAFPCGSKLGPMLLSESVEGSVDIVFSCLPHAVSAPALIPFIEQGVPVVDVSADFRLKDAAIYEEWYGIEHPAPELLESAVYGITEIHRAELSEAKIVGNPGCYPMAAILALAPALRAGIIELSAIVDAKSGISGGGRSINLDNHFSEVNESVHAYAVGGHRHVPEMVQELSEIAESEVAVTFVPHLVPMTRGILATCYARLNKDASQAEITQLYRDAYSNDPFVMVTDEPPRTKWTYSSNFCAINATLDRPRTMLIVTSALDNLVKGAAGAALQNANLVMGFEETAGLTNPPVFP